MPSWRRITLPDQQSGERDDERRHADERHDDLQRDRSADRDRGGDRDEPRILVSRFRHLQLGDHDACQAADVADREVDLADEQDKHDPDRDHRHSGHLADEVRELTALKKQGSST